MDVSATDVVVISFGCALAGVIAGTTGGIVVGVAFSVWRYFFPPRIMEGPPPGYGGRK